jgi:cell wall-associated NlpC family hydrolase
MSSERASARHFSPTANHPLGDEACRVPAAVLEAAQRAAVVAEARRWVGTPYRHRGRTLGAACDCANILIEVFAATGLIDRFDPGDYPPDWHQHRELERYLGVVEAHCRRVDTDERSLADRGAEFAPEPGDILMWRFGRTYSHSAIVTAWPNAIHAFAQERLVVEDQLARHATIAKCDMRVYSYWRR